MKTKIITGIIITLLSFNLYADVWCKAKNETVFSRAVCKKTEKQLDLLSLGLKGDPGEQGSSGIINTFTFNGAATPNDIAPGDFVILSPQVIVKITDKTQKITGVSQVSVGGSKDKNWGGYIAYDLCYTSMDTGVSGNFQGTNGKQFNLSGAVLMQFGSEQVPITAAGSVTNLTPGDYSVGVCIASSKSNTADITNLGWVNGWLIVTE